MKQKEKLHGKEALAKKKGPIIDSCDSKASI